MQVLALAVVTSEGALASLCVNRAGEESADRSMIVCYRLLRTRTKESSKLLDLRRHKTSPRS